MSKIRDLINSGTRAPLNAPDKRSAQKNTQFKLRPGKSAPIWVPNRVSVPNSSDLTRILALPTRPPFDDRADYSALVQELTAEFRLPSGAMQLLQQQAFSIQEMREVGGLVGLLSVGSGKTLLSLLLLLAMSKRGVKRGVLLVPSATKAQLLKTQIPMLATHWRLPKVYTSSEEKSDSPGLHLVTYTQLQKLETFNILEQLQPEMIIADEAQYLRRETSARSGRFLDYVKDACSAGTLRHIALLSGTMAQKSLLDLRFVVYALGKYAPIPIDRGVLQQWADALDPSESPAPFGALRQLCLEGETPHEAFCRRLISTPGVVATRSTPIASKLKFVERPVVLSSKAAAAMKELRRTWTLPWGEEIAEASVFSLYARQLACGFLYKRIWPRNEPEDLRTEWLMAQSAWNAEVNRYITKNRKPGMDTELALRNAAINGTWKSGTWARWAKVKDLAHPENEAVWIDDFLVEDAVDWGRKHVGLIWYEFDAVGERIAQVGGFTQIGRGVAGERAMAGLTKGVGAVVISRPSRYLGTDGLQYFFDEQLITTPMSGAAVNEQWLGRLHRLGQKSSVVTTHVYRHTPEVRQALEDAKIEAAYLQKTYSNQYKLCNAEFQF